MNHYPTFRIRVERRYAFLIVSLLMITGVCTAWGQNTAADGAIEFATKIVAPDTGPFALLSIPLSVNDCATEFKIRQQHLRSISFILEDRGGLGLEDFQPLTKDEKSGLALYAESGDLPEFFNFAEGDPTSDIPLILQKAPTVVDLATGYLITFEPSPVGGFTQIPIDSDGFPDFYIAARTSIELRHGDGFEAKMPPGMIAIEDRDPNVGVFTRFDLPFPSPEFGENLSTCLNFATLTEFSRPATFQGDIVQLYNVTKVGQRIANLSEPTTILSMDLIGAPTEEYFIREVRVNFVAIDFCPISWLWGPPGLPGQDVGSAPFFDYMNSPRFTRLGGVGLFPYIQTSKFLQNPELYQTFPPPLAWPNEFGTTVFDRNNPARAHYLADRGRDRPRVVTPEILLGLLKDEPGGVFLFTEGRGGTPGVYEPTVDRLLVLGDEVRFEDLDVRTVPREVINRLLPTELLRSSMSALPRDPVTGEVNLSFLLDDGPLDWLFLPGLAGLLASYGGFEAPDGFIIPDEVVEAYRVAPRDFSWDTGKHWLGLSREMIDFLLADAAVEASDEDGDGLPDGDGIDNSTEIFGRQLITGFTMILPIGAENPKELLRVPSTDSIEADTDPPEMFIAIQTSDRLRNLDGFLPFVLPGDITVGKGLDRFAAGDPDVETLPSVARVGQPRSGMERLLPERPGETRHVTNPLIGRPRPQFAFQDLTQPGPGENAANDNILRGPLLGSPEKAVIGINALDFGQNSNLMFNNTSGDDGEAVFFTESTVFETITVDFLPAPGETAFNTDIINGVTTFQGIDASLNRLISTHQVILYVDDDTPPGDGLDNDGDGMIDEELVNLIDDDNDGLIDEDCGDGDPAGINGVFDQYDDFILPLNDNIGIVRRPVEGPNQYESNYKRAVNHDLFVPDPADPTSPGIQIDPAAPFAPLVPIVPGSGNYQALFDLHPLAIGNLPWGMRKYRLPSDLLPSRIPDGPFGLTSDKDTALLDLTLPVYNRLPYLLQAGPPTEDGKLYLPLWPDIVAFDQTIMGAVTAAAGSGTNVKEVDLASVFAANGTPIGIAPGDGTVGFLDLRFANPSGLFSRYGLVPLITNSDGDSDGDPTTGDPPSPLFVSQLGWFVSTSEAEALTEYMNDIFESVADAHQTFLDSLQDAIDSWNDEVASYQEEYAAWDAEPPPEDGEKPEPPEPPEFDPDSLPEPGEVTIPDPGESLGLNNFPPAQDLTYEYLLQIPDEEFGPLRGNDYFVVLRAAQTAQVGDRFQVRIRPGGITYASYTDTNEVYSDKFPGVSSGSIVTSPIVVRSANITPEFEFISPGSGNNIATEDLTFEVSWIAVDPDNDAIINLYIDTDNKDFDGSLLVAGLTEGVDTRFTLDLPEDIPGFDPGLGYFVYARITDGINPPLFVYADGPILAADPSAGQQEGGIIVDPRGDQVDYYKLTRGGRIFNLGESPSLGDVIALGGTNLAIDMELSPDYAGAVVLATDGRVFAVGNVGLFSERVAADGEIVFENNPISDPTSGTLINHARDVEVDFERGAIYILDMDGDFVSLGPGPQPQLAPSVRIPGFDLYRDMELTPDGRGMYFLTFSGDLSTTGSAGGGSSLGFKDDLARDMELVVAGGGVAGVVALDAFGQLYAIGGTNVPPHLPSPSTEPVFRSLTRIANTADSYLLAEGGGRVHAATRELLILPRDVAIFGDEPGMTDDRIVDIEAGAFNLRDIPQILALLFGGFTSEDMAGILAQGKRTTKAVHPLLPAGAFTREDTAGILALTSDSYLDEQGMDRARFAASLRNFFDYFEIRSLTLAPGQGSVNVSFQGSKVIVDALVDWVYFDPQIDRFRPTESAVGQVESNITGFPADGGSAPGFPFSQTITIRDVGDGRGWNLEIWEIANMLNQPVDQFTFSQFQGAQMVSQLKRLRASPGNRMLAFFPFMSRGEEHRTRLRVPYHGRDGLNSLMFRYQQYSDRGIYAPPAMEMLWYTGIMSLGSSVFGIQMENIDGQFKITSLRMPQRLYVNSNGPSVSAESVVQGGGIALGDTVTVESPEGFSFTDGSMVPTIQPGDADLILESDTRLAVTRPTQGIMNLGANIDIFSLSTRDLLNTINLLTVLSDPLDTDPNTLYSTTAAEDNSYFVILRDGEHFALMTIVEMPDPTAAAGAITGIQFEWVFRDNFVLPPDF